MIIYALGYEKLGWKRPRRRLHQSRYLNPGEVEAGFPGRNGAEQEVGYCDLSKMCQPPGCSQRRQRVGQGGIAKLRGVRGHIFLSQGHVPRKGNRKPPQIVYHTLGQPLPFSLFSR